MEALMPLGVGQLYRVMSDMAVDVENARNVDEYWVRREAAFKALDPVRGSIMMR